MNKNIDRKRYNRERTVGGQTQVYDSYAGIWLALSSCPESSSYTDSFSGSGGGYGGGGASGSWGGDSGGENSGGGGCD